MSIIEETAKIYLGILKDFEVKMDSTTIILETGKKRTKKFIFNRQIDIFLPTKGELMMLILDADGSLLYGTQNFVNMDRDKEIEYYKKLEADLPSRLKLR